METNESIIELFGLGDAKPDQPPRFAKVTAVSGDTATVTVGASNVDAVRCCDCAANDVVLLETLPSGQLAAVGVKGYNGGGGGGSTSTWYGTCFTAAATAAKDVYSPGFTLAKGALIAVYMGYANEAAEITLNVNSTGAKTVKYRNGATSATHAFKWGAYDTILFVYDGSAWVFVSDQFEDIITPPVTSMNTDLPWKNGSARWLAASSATTTGKPMANGLVLESSFPSDPKYAAQLYLPTYQTAGRYPQWRATTSPNVWGTWNTLYTTASCGASYYGTCSTAAATAAKVVTCSGFVLATGAVVHVLFSDACTVSGTITLNVNGTGAKNVYKGTTVTGAANAFILLTKSAIATFIYDGTYWRYVSDTETFGYTSNLLADANAAGSYGSRSMHVIRSSNSMTQHKPMSNGYILSFDWESANHWTSQFFIPNTNGSYFPQWRKQNGSANGWSAWDTFYTVANPPSLTACTGTLGSAQLPIATTSALGGVKPDGTTITADAAGVISARQLWTLNTSPSTSTYREGHVWMRDGLGHVWDYLEVDDYDGSITLYNTVLNLPSQTIYSGGAWTNAAYRMLEIIGPYVDGDVDTFLADNATRAL